jgi:thioredoxin 2
MIISCPHCNKGNRIPIEKITQQPTCGACKDELLGLPISPNQEALEELIAQSDLPILIDFWAPWCGPCKMFTPTFEASAKAHANQVIHVKVDTQQYPAIGNRFNIRSIPTLTFFKRGKEIDRVSGALPPEQLQQFINKQLKP